MQTAPRLFPEIRNDGVLDRIANVLLVAASVVALLILAFHGADIADSFRTGDWEAVQIWPTLAFLAWLPGRVGYYILIGR